ncbi:response regulator [Telluribacter sp.]|jgi:DNA-binding response OmpR family regulator|uniref:response regulator n=1 Tax=Telluribacter sp. TaxID=1978767 RepID=UPI002E1011C0|nr:response regulator [Telluribacter sp.]
MLVPITCFLIDDDPDDQEIFTLALSKVDPAISCVTADDGIDALQKLKKDESFVPEFIFLDLNMPRMNGKQCLAELVKIDRLEQTPIIIYSTSSEPRDVMETKELGASDFIVKPSYFDALAASLSKVIKENPKG